MHESCIKYHASSINHAEERVKENLVGRILLLKTDTDMNYLPWLRNGIGIE